MKCTYQGCEDEGHVNHSLKVLNENNTNAELPFCKAHLDFLKGADFRLVRHHEDGEKWDFTVVRMF